MSLPPAVFLDRDGTIIDERTYLADPDGVELIPGSLEAMIELRRAGYAVVVVTNQGGIARGLYTLEDYHAVAERLDEVLEAGGMVVDATHFCPHAPPHTDPCDCRKPGTAMHRAAAEALSLDLKGSFFIGDKVTDVRPAEVLGGQGILVRTGYGADMEEFVPSDVWVTDDLAEAATRILAEGAIDPVFRRR